MASLTRGTTPTLIFELPFDTSEAQKMWISFRQESRLVIDKTLADVTLDETKVSVHLTQEETLALCRKESCTIQMRVLTKDGEALASQIISCAVADILKDGVIE